MRCTFREAVGFESCLFFSFFCIEFVAGLVKWLELFEVVLLIMIVFVNGLGGEGVDMFV